MTEQKQWSLLNRI